MKSFKQYITEQKKWNKKYGHPRPYEYTSKLFRHKFDPDGSPEHGGERRTESVPIKHIVPTQQTIGWDKVHEFQKNPPKEHPELIKHHKSGKYYVFDGHHRIVAARRNGATHIDATVYHETE